MICYAVIDTNVLVSALLSGNDTAATVQIVSKLIAGELVPIYSTEIMNEYKEVLARKKFKFPKEMIDYLLSAIDKYGILVEPATQDIILPDMKDLPFYEVVMEKRDDNAYLVTGNLKHFPKKPFIVTARQMIEILNNQKLAEFIRQAREETKNSPSYDSVEDMFSAMGIDLDNEK